VKSISECVTIEVEPYDSPTHVVIPIEDERMDDDNEMDLTNPNPEPKQAKPC